jgi:spore maturation protein CgeB
VLAVYSGSTLSLNHHHPMNDIVGVNTRAFELAASGACQVVDLKGELPGLFTPGEEVVAYRDLDDLKDQLGYYLAHPDEARAIGGNAMKRALQEHTLRHRIDEIINVVEQRFGKR